MSYQRELWERRFPIYIKGGDAYRCRRKTKAQLVAQCSKKGGEMSPKINTEVREGADDIEVDVSYEITNVEEVTTDVQNFSGIRVVLMSPKGDEGSVMLWQRKITGKGSKLGVFITALGNDTEEWLHKWVTFRQWSPRNRVMEVLEGASAKGLKSYKVK